MVENPAASEGAQAAGTTPRAKNEEGKFPKGIWIRLFAYLVAGHVFAGFLYLLFEVGAK
ncbi:MULTISPECIES: DUF6126 family protein [Streptomyces]|uniref:DUF6126 family protein n=1 Tax=Streptomyces TaxID=1883 RepID=UPI00025CCA1D|nr:MULTISPECIES: DUF6126 family protein [Streptomyces]EIF93717.1 small hydrophobic protein [Streptomyces tsukubensis NRRL18488]